MDEFKLPAPSVFPILSFWTQHSQGYHTEISPAVTQKMNCLWFLPKNEIQTWNFLIELIRYFPLKSDKCIVLIYIYTLERIKILLTIKTKLIVLKYFTIKQRKLK